MDMTIAQVGKICFKGKNLCHVKIFSRYVLARKRALNIVLIFRLFFYFVHILCTTYFHKAFKIFQTVYILNKPIQAENRYKISAFNKYSLNFQRQGYLKHIIEICLETSAGESASQTKLFINLNYLSAVALEEVGA